MRGYVRAEAADESGEHAADAGVAFAEAGEVAAEGGGDVELGGEFVVGSATDPEAADEVGVGAAPGAFGEVRDDGYRRPPHLAGEIAAARGDPRHVGHLRDCEVVDVEVVVACHVRLLVQPAAPLARSGQGRAAPRSGSP